MINLTEKIRIAMIKTNINQSELAQKSNQTKANLSNKMTRNDFKLSEFEKIVTALGCNLEISIITPTGERI